MRHLRSFLFAGAVLVLLLGACQPQPAPTEPPPPPATLVPVEPSAVPTLVATEAGAPATLQPIKLAGPPMEVGSTYRYVDGALIVAVPDQGPFLMGHGGQDNPEHQVTVSDFWIYDVEVSNQMYAWCVSVGKCTPPDPTDNPNFTNLLYVNYPVVGVNWQQSVDYCTFVHARLPTEAEWEKAASWDPVKQVHRIYPWGDNAPICDLLNFGQCVHKTTPVQNYPKGQSFYGLLNMSGNVFEWVSDWYLALYYGASPAQNPLGPDTGTKRSIRSSAFNSDGFLTEAARRSNADPASHRKDLGFRCVVEDPTYFAPFCSLAVSYPSTPGVTNKPCPDPSIEHHDDCVNKVAKDYVTVHNTSPTILDPVTGITGVGACLPGSNVAGVTNQCPLSVTITVNPTCDVPPSGTPGCPTNYSPDPGDATLCKVNSGGAGACPDGFEFNTAQQCCGAAAGTNSIPLCTVGQHYYNGACVDDATGPLPPSPISYTTNSGLTCIGDHPGGCKPGDPNYPTCKPPGGCAPNDTCCNNPNAPGCGGGPNDPRCPNGGTFTCSPNPNCSPTANSCPPICGCQ